MTENFTILAIEQLFKNEVKDENLCFASSRFNFI